MTTVMSLPQLTEKAFKGLQWATANDQSVPVCIGVQGFIDYL